MFHFAAPEVNGLGVRTLTPGLSRSSQVLMSFGLPLRTMNETTDFGDQPCARVSAQSSATSPALTRRVMSGSSEKATTSAARPASTARLWSPEAPKDCVNATPLPAVGLLEAGDDLVVDDLRAWSRRRARASSSRLPAEAAAEPPPSGCRRTRRRSRPPRGRRARATARSERVFTETSERRSGIKPVGFADNSTIPIKLGGQGRRQGRGRRPPECALASRRPVQHPVETFTEAERARLAPARHEPRPAGLRAGQPARDGQGRALRALLALPGHAAAPVPRRVRRLAAAATAAWEGAEGRRAAELYERIFLGYGDDSVAQLGGAHVAVRVGLQRPDQGPPAPAAGRLPRAVHALHRLRRADARRRLPLLPRRRARPALRARDGRALRRPTRPRCRASPRGSTSSSPATTRPRARARDPGQGARPPARPAARRLAVAHGHLRHRPDLRAAHPAPARPPAARGAPLRADDPRGRPGRHAELRRARRAPRPRRRVDRLPRGARARRRPLGARGWASIASREPDARPSVRLLHVDGDEDALLAALLFEAAGVGEEETRIRLAALSARRARRAARRPRRRARQPPPPPRPRASRRCATASRSSPTTARSATSSATGC